MYLTVHYTLAPGAPAQVLADFQRAFQGVAANEVISGYVVAKPAGPTQKGELVFNLVSVESAHDPFLSFVVVEIPDGQWWLVSDRVNNPARAAQIAGRVPVTPAGV